MEILICLFIFFAKMLETSLATFRIIVINNGKKMLGAILSAVIAIIWILSTSLVVFNIKENIVRIFFLAFGCFSGSFLGSFIEERLALGYTMLMVITSNTLGSIICNDLRKNGYAVTYTKATGKDSVKNILLIMVERKKRMDVSSIIYKTDENAMIISESASVLSGGFIG